jgi:hypothetical protein
MIKAIPYFENIANFLSCKKCIEVSKLDQDTIRRLKKGKIWKIFQIKM